jgi:hypothetical protein
MITLLVGVGVFITSQYVLKLVLEPIIRVRRAIADVSSTVLFRKGKISNATHHPEMAEELRRASSQLWASVWEVRWYSFFARIFIFGVPSKANTRSACRCLTLLAANANDGSAERNRLVVENSQALDELGKFLGIETRY